MSKVVKRRMHYPSLETLFACLRLRWLLAGALFAVLGSGPLLAQVDQLLNQLQPRGSVTDEARVLPETNRGQLQRLITELEEKSGAQIAVVTLPSLQGGEIRDFSNRLFEKWGIGKAGRDNGVLFLLALEEREIWVEIGYGLEGVLPDGRVGRLLDEAVIPYFRQGDYATGITSGVARLAAIIAEDAGVSLTGDLQIRSLMEDRQRRELDWIEILIGLFLLMILLPIVIRNPWILFLFLSSGRGGRGGFGGGGFGGGGFGGFGGGLSGGGGAGRSW